MKFFSCFSKKPVQITPNLDTQSKIETDKKKEILDNLEYLKIKINSSKSSVRQQSK